MNRKEVLSKSISQALCSLNSWIVGEAVRIKSLESGLREELRDRGSTMSDSEKGEFYDALTEVIKDDLRLRFGKEHSSLLRRAKEAGVEADSEVRRSVRGWGDGDDSYSKSQGDNKPTTIYGHAAVFNQTTNIGNYFTESIAPGAFAACLKAGAAKCVCLANHDSNMLLGRHSTRTLDLYEDKIGLFFECKLDDTTIGKDVYRQVKRRDFLGCSFSFTIGKDTWSLAQKRGDLDHHVILEVNELWDLGPVTFPQYTMTDVQVSRVNYLFDTVDDELEEQTFQNKLHRQRGERLKAAQKSLGLTGKNRTLKDQQRDDRLKAAEKNLGIKRK